VIADQSRHVHLADRRDATQTVLAKARSTKAGDSSAPINSFALAWSGVLTRASLCR
jgi:hypothetical protein